MKTTFITVRAVRLIAKKVLVVLVIAICCVGSFMLMAIAANAQDARNATSMAALKDKTVNWELRRFREGGRLMAKAPPPCISARLK